jgi:hypothetical protein
MKSYNGFTANQRQKAFNWYKAELASGRRVKPDVCCACGQTENVNGHSENYGAPYGDHIGEWAFCYTCHMAIHNRDKDSMMWEGYKAVIKRGWRFRAIRSWPVWKDWFLFVHELNAPADRFDAPEYLALEELEWQSRQIRDCSMKQTPAADQAS